MQFPKYFINFFYYNNILENFLKLYVILFETISEHNSTVKCKICITTLLGLLFTLYYYNFN